MNYLRKNFLGKNKVVFALFSFFIFTLVSVGTVFAVQINETSVEITSISPEVEGCIDISEEINVVGTATADAPPGQLQQYHVQIDWGDGSTDDETEDESFGTGQGISTKGFSGSHTYSADGDYTITAKIYHQTVPGQDGNGDDSYSLDICIGDEEPEDVCPNIEGTQETIPEGYELVEGLCVLIEEPVYGCTDPEALNYNEEANIDDQSCEYYEPNVCEPGVNLLQNPGFENPIVEAVQKWNIFQDGTTDLGWSVVWRDLITEIIPSIELQRGVNGWLPYEGDQYAELDGDLDGPGGSGGDAVSTEIFQTLPTVEDEDYTISFAFSPRPGQDDSENILKVYWEGNLVDTISADGTGNNNTDWETYEYVVTATSDESELRLVDGGTANGVGTFVDDVSVTCDVPDEEDDFWGELFGKKFRYIFEEGDYVKAEEPEIEGWEINLYDEEWNFLDTDSTDENGAYDFSDLDKGTYNVCEVLEDDWMQVRPEMDYTSDGVIVVENESPNSENEAEYCYQATLSDENEDIGVLHFGNYEIEYPFGFITNPENGDIVSGLIDLTAEYYDGDDDNDDIVQWAVRQGTCAANTNTVAGNVDGFNDPYSWDGNLFSAPFDADLFEEGEYCFVFNPKDDGDVDVRETSTFYIEHEDIYGCTDPEALNYNEEANIDDQSCEYSSGGDDEEPSIIIRKVVVGGEATADEFTLLVDGVGDENSTYFTSKFDSDGENEYELIDGTYDILEVNIPDDYEVSYENCNAIEISSEQEETPVCTITNTYVEEDEGGISGGGYSPNNSSGGEVLGAFTGDGGSCGMYIFDYMKQELQNNPAEVTKLQEFLNQQGIFVPVTGFFGPLTDQAVRAFQAQYATEVLQPWANIGLGDGSPTGYVYKTTRWKINNIVCPGSENYPVLP